MRPFLPALRAACLPFVTRSLRGPRRRRFVLGSALLGLFVVLCGTWIGLSPGELARDVRVSLDLERNHWDREQLEFTIFVDDHRELARVQRELESSAEWSTPRYRAEEGWLLLDAVASPHVQVPARFEDLRRRARDLRNERIDLAPPDLDERRQYQHFDWSYAHDRRRLEAILDAELVPRVVVYRSPLDLAQTIRVIGGLAGSLLLLLGMVIAPLWVGVSVAQELHENTLQPLTGTALTARQLVVGLVVGALVPVAITAAPLVLVHLSAAAIAGRLVPALGLLLMTLAMAGMLVGLAMLIALGVGKRRAPGIVGIGLLALLGLAGAVGLAVGLELRSGVIGAVTVMPAAGPGHLLAEAFFPMSHLSAADARGLDLRLVLATVGALVLGGLALRAIERIVGGTHRDGALGRIEAAAAALVLLVLATAALPERNHFGEVALASIAVALLPLQLVLLGRAPGGDVPPALRRVPVAALLREHAVWIGGAAALALLVCGPPSDPHPGAILGLMHLAWALGVAALVTLRAGTLPASIPTKVWLMVCVGVVMLEYGTAAVWCLDSPDGALLFPLAKASPVLGLVHVGLFLWIPISLLRAFVPPERAKVDVARLPELGE